MTATANTVRSMSLWRLEWLRLTRTRRLVALVATYVLFGLTGPVLARYMSTILERVGSDVVVIAPEPSPLQGLATYGSNVNQIGLLVYVLVVSSAVALDAQREMAVFLRTRVPRYSRLLLPKFVLSVAAGSVAFLAGTAAAWAGTVALLGTVDATGVVLSGLLVVLYLAFVAAVASALGARLDSVLTTAVGTIVVALGVSLLGTIGSIGDWLPSHLLGALTTLPFGGDAVRFVPSTSVTIVATIALLAAACHWGQSREG
jgi:ABC-2 type transport system permease protein